MFVGLTGCGKSTTINGVLREINNDEIKILTCEDQNKGFKFIFELCQNLPKGKEVAVRIFKKIKKAI